MATDQQLTDAFQRLLDAPEDPDARAGMQALLMGDARLDPAVISEIFARASALPAARPHLQLAAQPRLALAVGPAAAAPLPLEAPSPAGPAPVPTPPPLPQFSLPSMNFGENVSMKRAIGCMRVSTRQDVHRAIREVIAAANPDPTLRGMRAVGVAHSASPIVNPTNTVAEPGTFENPLPPTPAGELHQACALRPAWYSLAPDALALHVALGAGQRVKDVTAALDSVGLALPMTGAFSNQTCIGAMCTGTHGSGSQFGPMHTFVQSVQLIATDGQQPLEYRVERTQGITLRAAYLQDNPAVQLIQDDAAFQAVLVGLGNFGYITSVIVEAVKSFPLLRMQQLLQWPQVRAQLEPTVAGGWPRVFDGTYSNGVLLSPYPGILGDQPAAMTFITESPVRPAGAGAPSAGTVIADFLWDIARGLANAGILQPQILALAVRGAAGATNEWGPSFELFSNAVSLPSGYSVEYAFPLATYLAAVDDILANLQTLSTGGDRILGTISIRFVRQDDAFVSMTEGRDSVFVEVLTLAGINTANAVFTALEQVALRHDGRPHWGQFWNIESLPAIAGLYPRFHDWGAQITRFDPTGFFENDFTRAVSSVLAPAVVAATG